MKNEYDLIIANGGLADGSGGPSFKADIGLKDGRIAKIAPGLDPESTEKVIDATGLTVCPGFIDPHSHDDCYVLRDPTVSQKVLQGVTTVVTGNCGFTMAPTPLDKADFFKKISGIMGAGGFGEVMSGISTFDDYLQLVEKAGPGVNVVPLVGHASLRVCGVGWENRAPSSGELAEMCRLADESLEAGAFGFSTGLIYVPATYSRTDEILAIAEVAAGRQGIYATHIRSEGDQVIEALEEAVEIGRRAGLPVHISHHKVWGKANQGRSRETLALIQAARDEGLQVTCDQYPYTAGATYLDAYLPPTFASGGASVYAKKLKDPAVRRDLIAQIEDETGKRWENLIKGSGFDNIYISFSEKHREYLGKSLARIATEEDRNPYDVFFDLVGNEPMGIGTVVFFIHEEDMENIMQCPVTMIGSDGIPALGSSRVHPRMTGTFPRVLGRYVREKGLLTFEEAVRKMTSLTARTFNIPNKGLIKEGYDADLVLVDRETVSDRGDYEDALKAPDGIPYVLVGGVVAVDKGGITGRRGGRLLRRTN